MMNSRKFINENKDHAALYNLPINTKVAYQFYLDYDDNRQTPFNHSKQLIKMQISY